MQGVEAAQADFRGADLRLANFGGAYLEGAMMPPPAAHPSPSEIAKAGKQARAELPAKTKSNDKANGQSL